MKNPKLTIPNASCWLIVTIFSANCITSCTISLLLEKYSSSISCRLSFSPNPSVIAKATATKGTSDIVEKKLREKAYSPKWFIPASFTVINATLRYFMNFFFALPKSSMFRCQISFVMNLTNQV